MEPIKDMKTAIAIRNEILKKYTSRKARITSSFIPSEESKDFYPEVKGYASINFYIEPEKVPQLIEEIKEIYAEEKELITKSGLYPLVEVCNYEEKDDLGRFVPDPDIKIVRFAFELHEGDYKRLTAPLSPTEEDGMRNMPSARTQTREERRLEDINKRHTM